MQCGQGGAHPRPAANTDNAYNKDSEVECDECCQVMAVIGMFAVAPELGIDVGAMVEDQIKADVEAGIAE